MLDTKKTGRWAPAGLVGNTLCALGKRNVGSIKRVATGAVAVLLTGECGARQTIATDGHEHICSNVQSKSRHAFQCP